MWRETKNGIIPSRFLKAKRRDKGTAGIEEKAADDKKQTLERRTALVAIAQGREPTTGVVLTPSCRFRALCRWPRFSEGPHLLLGAIYLIREPLLLYIHPSLFPFSLSRLCVGGQAATMLGISAWLLRKRTPFASGLTSLRVVAYERECVRAVGVCVSNTDPPHLFVPFRFVPIQATVNDAREGRTRVVSFSLSLSLPSKNLSVRTQIKVSKEPAIKQAYTPLPLIVRKRCARLIATPLTGTTFQRASSRAISAFFRMFLSRERDTENCDETGIVCPAIGGESEVSVKSVFQVARGWFFQLETPNGAR